MASPPLQWIWHVGPQVDRMTGCWGIPWTSKSIFGGVFSTRLLRNPNYMWRIQQLQPVHEHRFTTGVPSKVKLIHCRAWKQPFPKWRMVEATTNILFHPGGDYICASFARNVFSKQDDEWWICVNDSRPCCGTWRMESWCPYCKCLKQRWPVTALSWKQKDIQRLQTSNRYTITKQGVYQTSSRYHDIRYHFSYKVHTYLYMKQFFEMFKSETCRKTFHISNISTLSKDQQKIS